jgi:hypothetical protein
MRATRYAQEAARNAVAVAEATPVNAAFVVGHLATVELFNAALAASVKAEAPAEKVRLLGEAQALLARIKAAAPPSPGLGMRVRRLQAVERQMREIEADYRARGYFRPALPGLPVGRAAHG